MSTAYAGNPDNFPSTIPILSGSDTPNTPTFNAAYGNGTLDRTAYLKAHQGLSGLLSQNPSQAWTLGIGPQRAAFYDQPYLQSWLISEYGAVSGQIGIYWGNGDSAFWKPVSAGGITNANPASAITVDTLSNIWVAALISATSLGSWHAVGPLGGSWTASTPTAVVAATDYQIVPTFGGGLPSAVGSGTAAAWSLGRTGVGGYTSTLAGTGGSTVQNWILRSNGTVAVAIPAAASAATVAYSTPDGGITWAANTIGLSASEIPKDLTWDSVRQRWLLVTSDGTNNFIWTSPDAAIWTKRATLGGPSIGAVVSAVTCVQGNYIGLSVGTTNQTNGISVVMSLDGITWTGSTIWMVGADATNIPKIFSSPNQVAFSNTPNLAGTGGATSIRFSGLFGLGDANL